MPPRTALAAVTAAAWTATAVAQTAAPVVPADPPPAAGATAVLVGDAPTRGPLGRFLDAYRPQPPAPDAPEPARRAPAAPFASPPFPFAEYIGPTIGVPDTTSEYPLMKALTGTPVGDFLGLSKTRIYGWANAGVSFSTSNNSNFPLSYTVQPNQLVLNQLVVRAERSMDTVQQDHWDWGYRISNVYGVDPRFTVAKGLASDPLLKRNQEYTYDPVEVYGQVYVPGVAEGMVIRVGRFISPPDIEAQLSPDNYLYTHSLMFTVDPYTFTGVQAQIKLSNNWSILFGVHGTNDQVPWSGTDAVNGQLMARWVNDRNTDSVYFGVNSIGDGRYRVDHDNLQMIVGTWTHKFSDCLHSSTEVYYIWQYDALAGGSVINGPPKPFFTNVGPGALIPGRSDSVGAVNYTNYKLSDKTYMTFRPLDILADIDGQRTGYKNTYASWTAGIGHYLTPLLLVRPELRYERGFQTPAYDNGTRKDQWSFNVDAILRF